ncbi:flagellin N-terminal helical domain-containing protein [Sphingomonas sanguinis]|jgi:flagellar hook-associated protein 3 FlgL|uniref:Flagellar hook-associated protein 3 n=1 Tax=Sphingomonas sanguinis TaxID=33051 RepID=A0A7Y7QXV8_9SPHN|nr:flagellin [Sphingomonas sanguinis]MBZ6383400.1 flagellar hook-associated protein 3 [Sphingomonas sanguinis]NNG48614.1 flagellar hook-associated protein 3 [Sphingomonas sanguinis]NNG54163.1 flagellar hook-associated protein 3 [Sphingomonas sanguinis]NVP32695.1 flagellar hook-associated protein 3 [Sphingomonas sanguinis]
MQISNSTSTLYESTTKRMAALQGKANELMVQNATGKRLIKPSDDAAASAQIAQLDRADADSAVYKGNLNLAKSVLQQVDTTLGSIGDQLKNAAEIATKAANGTLSDYDRSVLGDQLIAIRDQLVQLGNTRDMRNQPLFGTVDGTDAVQLNNGTATYADSQVSAVPIDRDQTVEVTVSAKQVFQSGNSDTFTVLNNLITGLKTPGTPAATLSSAIDQLNAANNNVATVQASVGARETRVTLQESLMQGAATDRATLRSSVEDVDIASNIAQLQQTMTVLQATQASFSKLAGLSLFDYLK